MSSNSNTPTFNSSFQDTFELRPRLTELATFQFLILGYRKANIDVYLTVMVNFQFLILGYFIDYTVALGDLYTFNSSFQDTEQLRKYYDQFQHFQFLILGYCFAYHKYVILECSLSIPHFRIPHNHSSIKATMTPFNSSFQDTNFTEYSRLHIFDFQFLILGYKCRG